jgi:carbon starvation protein CstA
MRVRREQVPPRPRFDVHDPTAGIGGAAPAASALTLRLWLAGLAFAGCVIGIVLAIVVGGPVALIVVLGVVAATAVVDVAVIAARVRRGEAG